MFPSLPLELWLHVIELATHVPDTLGDPLMNRANPRLRTERYNNALATKRRIALVCHSWHEFVTPFLYGHIVVSRLRQSPPLSTALAVDCDFRGARRYGELVKRLDILLPGTEWDSVPCSITPILKATPNLSGLIANIPRTSWRPLGAFLHSAIADNLQSFRLVKPDPPLFPPLQYFSFMVAHPQLKYLDCNILAFPHHGMGLFREATGDSVFSCMEELKFPFISLSNPSDAKSFPSNTLPNLVKIAIECRTQASDH
ncbi:hypothetical protein NMY22_g4632 [Coprinellus aureogranulatus]|nr:hypothetical protein NMY22_g4632 [Coprinellus aureogranulatus]